MIDSIVLNRFMKHKKLKLFFTGGLNIIIGKTGSGKSTIFRALELLINNKPSSSEKTLNSPKYKIQVRSGDNLIVREPKEYRLIDIPSGESKSFKAFGTEVPSEVKKVLPIQPINWQKQLSKHFILFETPGIVAKAISEYSGTNEKEGLILEVKKKLLGLKQEKNHLILSRKEATETMARLYFVRKLYAKSEDLVQLNNQMEELEVELEEIESITARIKKIREKIKDIDVLENIQGKMEKIHKLKDQFQNKEREMYETINLYEKLNREVRKIKNIEKITDIKKEVENIYKMREEMEEKKQEMDYIFDTTKKIEKTRSTLKKIEESLTSIREEIKKINSKITKCPTCGAKWTGEKHENINSR